LQTGEYPRSNVSMIRILMLLGGTVAIQIKEPMR